MAVLAVRFPDPEDSVCELSFLDPSREPRHNPLHPRVLLGHPRGWWIGKTWYYDWWRRRWVSDLTGLEEGCLYDLDHGS